MTHLSAYFSLTRPAGGHDAKLLKRELDTLPGVTSVSIGGSRLAVDYDSTATCQEEIRQKIQDLGFEPQSAE